MWSFDLKAGIDAVLALAYGTVLDLDLTELVAVDPTSGEEYWRIDVGGHRETAAPHGETSYVAGTRPVRLHTTTGKIQWSVESGGTLALNETGIYTTRSINGSGGIFTNYLNGEDRWHFSLGKIVGPGAIFVEMVWVTTMTGPSRVSTCYPGRRTGRGPIWRRRKSTPDSL